MKLNKLNDSGFSHLILAVGVVVIFAIAGVAYLVSSSAASNSFLITYYDPQSVASGPCRMPHGHNTPRTKKGSCPRPGHNGTISVDPRVIPLGSKVCIQGIGTRIAEDTGSGINGRHIDVFTTNHSGAIKFGKHNRHVYRGACR